MKRISVFLSLILLLTSLSSCAVISDRSNPSSESDSNTIDSRTQTAPGQTAESSATTDTAHTDITSYLQYFVSYFHEPYQRGDAVTQNNLLYQSFLFCFSNRDLLDFVEIDEEKSLMSIPEKELERFSSDLISHSGDLSAYRTTMEITSDSYSTETGTYIVCYARDYWNEDPYYLDFDENEKVKKPQISETETELAAIVETYYAPDLGTHETVRKMEYKFEKVIDNDFLFYRLLSIREVS